MQQYQLFQTDIYGYLDLNIYRYQVPIPILYYTKNNAVNLLNDDEFDKKKILIKWSQS